MSNAADKSLDLALQDYANGAMRMWLRGLPPRLALGIDPTAVAAAIQALCDAMVAEVARHYGGKPGHIPIEHVRVIQAHLLDDIIGALNYIFYGSEVAA